MWLRIENGHPIILFELDVVVAEGAQDHGVAGPGRQQIVHLRPHLVVATYAASGLPLMPGANSIDYTDSSTTPWNTSDTDMALPPHRSRDLHGGLWFILSQ